MQQFKRFGVLFLLMFACTFVTHTLIPQTAHAQAPDKEFTISVGETLTFSARGVRSVSIGLPNIADAQAAGADQLLVTGKQPGTTTININGSSGQTTLLIRVVGTNPQSLAEEVREVLGSGSGVDVRVVKGRVLLEGEVAGEKFKNKISVLSDLYPNQLLNFTTYREAFVEGARMVAVDLDFVQLATLNRDELGVQWGEFVGANYTFGTGDVPLYYGENADLSPGVLPDESGSILSEPAKMTGGEGLTSYFSLVGQVNMVLNFLVQNGLVKTINHGRIITEAGTPAEYHNGGTLIVPIAGVQTNTVHEIPYGLRVKVTPVIDVNNQVKLDIEMEYSELDLANAIGDIPALRNTTVNSVVNTLADQSVLVSSQTNTNESSNEDGFWLLSRIPILGWLFKSRNMLGSTLDNALFVTPRVYEPGKSTHDEMIDGVFKGLIDAGADPDELPELRRASRSARDAAARAQQSGGNDPELME